jgi:chitinase
MRLAWLLPMLMLTTLVVRLPAEAPAPNPVVVGYLPEYRLDAWSPDRIGPVTDLVYFGIVPGADGSSGTARIPEATLAKLKQAKTKSGCRLILCAGGWNRSAGFAPMTADPAIRAKFIAEMLQFCEAHGFDGVDYDWEHPKGKAEEQAYADLIAETKKAFSPKKRIVTAAIAGWMTLPEEAYQALDRVHLMAYDQPFPQATMAAAKTEVANLQKQGCPASKIAVGIPFYGRNKAGEARTWEQLTLSSATDRPADVLDGYAYNSPKTIQEKLRWIREDKLAGIMIWELGQDAAPPLSLLDFIAKELSTAPQP